MRDYYEDLWRDLPGELSPPHWELRRSFLLSQVRTGDRALDLGAGEGDFTAELAAAGARPIGAEVAAAAIARACAVDEVYEAGDAYYAPPGHIPVVTGGTEVVEFSPTEDYAKTQAVLARNLAAAQAG